MAQPRTRGALHRSRVRFEVAEHRGAFWKEYFRFIRMVASAGPIKIGPRLTTSPWRHLRTAPIDLNSQVLRQDSFGEGKSVGIGRRCSVSDLYMVGFMSGHHLITGNAVENTVHHRPLERRFAPTSIGLGTGKACCTTAPNIHFQFTVAHENSRPDNFAGLRNAAHSAAAQSEIHWRLPVGICAGIPADMVGGWRSTGDLENPHEFGCFCIRSAPTHIVQGRLHRLI